MAYNTVSHFVFECSNGSLENMDSRLPSKGEVCSYCGHPYKQMLSMSQFELARYNNWHLHKERNSKLFCLPCAYLLRTDDFRRKALIVTTEGIQFFLRKTSEDRELLGKFIFYAPPKPPFIICIPSDYRKHIVLRAKINYSQEAFHVQFGEDAIIVQPLVHKSVYETVKLLYEAGAAQNQILHKTYSSKINPNKLEQLEDFIAPWRGSSLLFFLLELAKPMVEEE